MSRFLVVVLGVAALLAPQAAGAVTTEPSPSATVISVNTGPGDQTDPHVSGDWVVYTDFSNGSHIRYRNLVTNLDAEIPGVDGATDSLSDVSGSTAVFVRFGAGSHSVWSFDLAAGGPAVELDPQVSSNRRVVSVGGRTIAWQDFGLTTTTSPEIVLYDLDTHGTTRLTTDSLYDRDPAVSPDGTVVTWSKCTSLAGGCVVWDAVRTGTSWAATALTGGGAESTLPDSDGTVVTYTRALGFNEADIAWQPVNGGTEGDLSLPSLQQNSNVSDGLVVFESYDPAAATPNFDLYAYDLTDDELFRLTDTPEDESLNDVYVAPNGTATVAWSRHEATGDDDVFAEQFVVPDRTTSPTLVATVQPPIEPDGSSDFTANRVVPVKFALTVDGAPTCDLPPATMTVTRMGAPATQALVPTTFHVTDCQYQLNLNTRQLGPGTYVIGIVVNGHEVGAASFRLH